MPIPSPYTPQRPPTQRPTRPQTHLHDCRVGKSLCRWNTQRSAIPVYIDPPHAEDRPPAPAMAEAYEEIIQTSLQAWSDASGGKLRFTYTEDPASARIIIQPQRNPLRTTAHCYRYIQEDCHIESALVFLHLPFAGETPQRLLQRFRHEVLQVLGHALGMGRVRHVQGVHITLTPEESETFRWLYHLPLPVNAPAMAQKFELHPTATVDDIITALATRQQPPTTPPPKTTSPFQQAVFLTRQNPGQHSLFSPVPGGRGNVV